MASAVELLKLWAFRSYCLPLVTYCIGSLPLCPTVIYKMEIPCRPLVLRVNISVVCSMFRISNMTILSTFKTVTIINFCIQTVCLHLLFIVILHLWYSDNVSVWCAVCLSVCLSPSLSLFVCLSVSMFLVFYISVVCLHLLQIKHYIAFYANSLLAVIS